MLIMFSIICDTVITPETLYNHEFSGADPGEGVDWASHPPSEKPISPKSPNLGPNVG